MESSPPCGRIVHVSVSPMLTDGASGRVVAARHGSVRRPEDRVLYGALLGARTRSGGRPASRKRAARSVRPGPLSYSTSSSPCLPLVCSEHGVYMKVDRNMNERMS